MTHSSSILRLGLLGPSGAGKGTVASIISAYAEGRDIVLARVRIADPLYAAQKGVYDAAGLPLPSFYSQDGELLAFLASHLRKLKEDVLLVPFSRTVHRLEAELIELGRPALILCDDVRPPDAEFVRSLGFRLVEVVASSESCFRRRRQRGDLTVALSGDGFEAALRGVTCDYTVDNSGSLDLLGEEVSKLLKECSL